MENTLNERQKKAAKNIKNAANDLIGGLENTLYDYSEDDEEYVSAKKTLSDHNLLVNEVYLMSTTEVYGGGSVWFGKVAQKFIQDIRFCGKEWLMDRCDKAVTSMGY